MTMASSGTPVVFVPGAWMGSWSWMPIARRFAAHDRPVSILDLPGLGYGSSPRGLTLQDAVTHVVDHLVARDLRDAVLVCHSWGGYPATGAHRSGGRVRKVVYYNAVVPAPDVCLADENETYGDIIRQAIAGRPDGDVPIDAASVAEVMMRDEADALRRIVFELTVPQPGRYFTDVLADASPVSTAGLEAVDAAYVLGVDDIALARPGAEFAARLAVPVIEVPGTHMAMFTRPDVIAPVLDAAC